MRLGKYNAIFGNFDDANLSDAEFAFLISSLVPTNNQSNETTV